MVIAYASFLALMKYVRSSNRDAIDKLEIRLALGKSLAVALEFLLAADIVKTAIAPNWDDLGKLAAIAALRTLLNYFLERELKQPAEIQRTELIIQESPEPKIVSNLKS